MKNLLYDSENTIIFMRLSVVITDSVLYVGSWMMLKRINFRTFIQRFSIFLLVLINSSLILVDHVHFQYNGILLGILFIAISFTGKNPFLVTFFFGTLILMKHLFVSLLPVFMCAVICQAYSTKPRINSIVQLATIIAVALGLLFAAFGPFVLMDGSVQLYQMFKRLFPFDRGLIHAYWAPNIWAMYVFMDKVLYFISSRVLKFQIEIENRANLYNSSSGKIGNYVLAFLPTVSAFQCLVAVLGIITAISIFAVLPKVRYIVVIRSLVFASYTSFMLGYHVHEKAIIIPFILQTFLIYESQDDRVLYLFLIVSATISIFPLIYGGLEWQLKGEYCFAF